MNGTEGADVETVVSNMMPLRFSTTAIVISSSDSPSRGRRRRSQKAYWKRRSKIVEDFLVAMEFQCRIGLLSEVRIYLVLKNIKLNNCPGLDLFHTKSYRENILRIVLESIFNELGLTKIELSFLRDPSRDLNYETEYLYAALEQLAISRTVNNLLNAILLGGLGDLPSMRPSL